MANCEKGDTMSTKKTLYTFGYLHSSANRVFSEMISLHVPCVDIRYSATSHKLEYNGYILKQKQGLVYAHIPELGNTRYLENLNGDFREPIIDIANMDAGMEALSLITMQHSSVAIFCACSDVEHCHRKVVAEEAHRRYGWEIVHLPVKKKRAVVAQSLLFSEQGECNGE